MTSTLTSKGQITIPQPVREALGLKTGQKLDFRILPNGHVELEVLRQATLEDLQTLLPPPEVTLSLQEMDQAIGDALQDARH